MNREARRRYLRFGKLEHGVSSATVLVDPRVSEFQPPQTSAASSRFTPWEVLFLLLLPVVAFLLLHFDAVRQNRMLDPYVYTGYIYNFADLQQRFGITYYGVRFGLILPARICAALFGEATGYFVLRYLLALVFGIPLYAVCKRYLSPATATATYVVAVSSPYFAR